MKELTIEEKAKAYDEALERAKAINNEKDVDVESGTTTCEYIFPELKESEDEKIKKEIISILRNTYWTSNRNRFNELVAWLEKQRDKDKLIQELGEYKVKYTQEILEKYITSMSNKDDERLRKTTIAFLKDFAEQGYENAVECIDWLEKQGETSPILSNSLNTEKNVQKSADKVEPKFKVGDKIRHKYTNKDDVYEISKVYDDSYGIVGFNWLIYMKYQDQYELVPNKFDPKTLKPFNKVLVNHDDIWKVDFFSHICQYEPNGWCQCIGDSYYICIPYNDETKHLVGTRDEAPEFYKYWED